MPTLPPPCYATAMDMRALVVVENWVMETKKWTKATKKEAI